MSEALVLTQVLLSRVRYSQTEDTFNIPGIAKVFRASVTARQAFIVGRLYYSALRFCNLAWGSYTAEQKDDVTLIVRRRFQQHDISVTREYKKAYLQPVKIM